MLSESVQLAIVSQLPATLAAVGSLFASIGAVIAVWYTNRTQTERLQALKGDNQVADAKLNTIHELTNSTLTAANKRIDELEAIIKQMLNEKKQK